MVEEVEIEEQVVEVAGGLPSEGFCSTRLSSSDHSVLSLFISL